MCQPADSKPSVLCPRCMTEVQEPTVWQSKWRKTRMKVLVRDHFRCKYPGCTCTSLALLTIHHIKPKSEGGKDRPNNLVTMCQYHHALTHDALPKESKPQNDELSRVHEFGNMGSEAQFENGN